MFSLRLLVSMWTPHNFNLGLGSVKMWITYRLSLMERDFLGKILLIIRYSIYNISREMRRISHAVNKLRFVLKLCTLRWLDFLVFQFEKVK